MKKLLLAAAAVTTLAASPALAATGTTATYTVQGTVTAICSASATGTLDFGTGGLTDANGAVVTTSQTATDAAAYCNGVATTLAVTHTALTTSGTAPTGFVKLIEFVPEVATGTVGGTVVTTTGNTVSAATVGAFTGLSVTAKTLSTVSNNKPIAGSYTGSIVVTLTPTA